MKGGRREGRRGGNRCGTSGRGSRDLMASEHVQQPRTVSEERRKIFSY